MTDLDAVRLMDLVSGSLPLAPELNIVVDATFAPGAVRRRLAVEPRTRQVPQRLGTDQSKAEVRGSDSDAW